MPEPFAAQVMALEANYLRVRLDHPGPDGRRLLLCTRRARLAHGGLKVMVGDRVGVEGCDWIEGRAAVGSLEPRRNQLQRPALANVDQVLVVMALAQPAIDPESFSRFLLSAETAGAEVIPVLSKADLVSAQQRQQWLDRLVGWGYQALAISRHDPAGLAALADRLGRGVAVLCGPSGVGKSSLLNALVPDLKLRTAAVSGKLQRGRHTTRHVELHDLPSGGLLADTPGFNRPELPADPELVAQLFPEIRQQLEAGVRCRFRNCRHLKEPGCGLQRQWERYPSYVELMG
ncbi:ribosome small subunit-dependent GTPase A [Synechococcus sp. MIT S9452]|uniref:ribosome small subunit-dependent GTPase A n=1 Tax=Synechococcus sp. MIT S9452 TaxID=3082546 RepID=UPI0039A555EE